MNDILAVGHAKEIRNCRKIKTLNKFENGLKKTNFPVVSTGKEKVERIDERIQEGTVLETDRYKYQGIVINT